MQEKSEELTRMGLQSYFDGLSQKDKDQLRSYVAMKFELSYLTVYGKFNGKSNFSAAELLALRPIIDGELWRS